MEWSTVPLLHPYPDQVLANRRKREAAKKKRKAQRKTADRPFVTWDGEGHTLETGEHIYTLLANSEGDFIRRSDGKGMGTKRILDFLLRQGLKYQGVNHVGFALSYDVNMILGDLPREELELVHNPPVGKEWAWCPSVRTAIMYHPHKVFKIRRKVELPHLGVSKTATFKLDDCFSFFSTSFEKACLTYLGEGYEGSGIIAEGKALRAVSFEGYSPDDVLRYCRAELHALVLLLQSLRDRLSYIGIYPRDWYGPGAIAVKLLQAHHVEEHKGELPSVTDRGGLPIALRHSYAGGRFEVFQYGSTSKPVWRYDRRSAYPYAMTLLPCDVGSWEHVTRDQHSTHWDHTQEGYKLPLGIYWATWENRMLPTPWRPQPLFKRAAAGLFTYPYKTTGWVWSYELEQILRLPYGRVTWDEAWLFHPEDPTCRPFSFVPSMYKERAILKAAGHPAELALKLALNSIYGKLIQQKGWRPEEEGAKPPTYFCLSWASQITSITRAALMQVVIDNEAYDDVISFETDALFVKRPLTNIPIGKELGEWEEAELHNFVNIMSGIYGSDEQPHVRGMQKVVWPEDPQGMMRDLLRDRYRPYPYKINTFITLGDGLRDLSRWRHWLDVPREVRTLEPTNGLAKRNHDILHCECRGEEDKQLDTWHITAVYPKGWHGLGSRAYELEWLGPEREYYDLSELEEVFE